MSIDIPSLLSATAWNGGSGNLFDTGRTLHLLHLPAGLPGLRPHVKMSLSQKYIFAMIRAVTKVMGSTIIACIKLMTPEAFGQLCSVVLADLTKEYSGRI
jgi:hypothetical protein